MTGVTLSFGMHNQTDVTVRVEEPADLADLFGSTDLDVDMSVPPFADFDALNPPPNGTEIVRLVGEALYQRLSTNQGVVQALTQVAATLPGDRVPIHVRISPGNPADALPWETLFHPQVSFLGLDDRSPLARVAGYGGRVERSLLDFQEPLRITAVLAARDRDATPEWEALQSACEASPLRTKLYVLCSQDAVHQVIQASGRPDVQVDFVPPSNEALVRRIAETQPHLLHFFSHGSSGYGSGYLEIATRELHGTPSKLLYLDPDELGRATRNAWLVVLNACQGAVPGSDARSVVSALVRNGTPAAIGMRQEIDVHDAHVFCRALYREVLRRIEALPDDGQTTVIDWSSAMRTARTELCSGHSMPCSQAARRHKEWSLPVLYLRPEPLEVRRLSDSADGDHAAERAEWLAELNVLQNILARAQAVRTGAGREQFEEQVRARIAVLQAQIDAVGV